MEERIRDGLTSEVDRFHHRDRTLLGPPRLASSVRKRVRRHQAGTVVLALALVAGVVVGSVQAVSQVTKPAQTLPAGQLKGSQEAPPGWPVISFGDTEQPTLDYRPGELSELTDPKVFVAYGSFSAPSGEHGTWYVDVYTQKRGLYPNDD